MAERSMSLDELFRLTARLRLTVDMRELRSAVGTVNPRPPGWQNRLIQSAKKLVARSLSWYTRPLQDVNAAVSSSLEAITSSLEKVACALDELSMDKVGLEWRLAYLEKENAALLESIQQQFPLLAKPVTERVGNLPVPPGSITPHLARAGENSRSYAGMDLGNDRTAYLIGLFGTGRWYVNQQIQRNMGQRAKYFRDTIRLHPGPTPMIYSGHATMQYVSRGQESPAVMNGILEAVESGFADLIFLYRHPLDSLLTNWVWWRTYLRDKRMIMGISQIYKNTDDLCADLEKEFSEFKSFAEGDPSFFAASPGAPFLSFSEFVEETELHAQSPTLALRLEDFMADPAREFSKIVRAMSVDLDLSRLSLVPPRTKPYGYLAVKDKVPRFGNFVEALSAETKRRIEKIGYSLNGGSVNPIDALRAE
jgi:hypothetical protein